MPLSVAGQVGEQKLADGVGTQPFRQGGTSEAIVSELHGRFFEQTLRQRTFSSGMSVTSINNATFTTGTLGATCTPIVGLYNPLSSPMNCVIAQAILQVIITALQNTGGGPFVWAAATGQNALTLGTIPFNRKTLVAAGSFAKGLAGVALTGLVGNLTVLHAAALAGGNIHNIASLDTAAGYATLLAPSVENFDGSLIVPPGGVLALLATTTPIAQSAASAMMWEEVPF